MPDEQARIESPTFERDDLGEQQPDEKPTTRGPRAPASPDASCPEISCAVEGHKNPCCPPRRPKPRTGTALDAAMVKTAIAPIRPTIAACSSNAGSGATGGVVKLAVTVTPSGTIKSIAVVATPSPALAVCVVSAMQTATFAKTDHGGTFRIPFRL